MVYYQFMVTSWIWIIHNDFPTNRHHSSIKHIIIIIITSRAPVRVFPTSAGRAQHGVANRFLPRAHTRHRGAPVVRQCSPPPCVLTTNRVVRNIKFILYVHLVFNQMVPTSDGKPYAVTISWYDYHTRIYPS